MNTFLAGTFFESTTGLTPVPSANDDNNNNNNNNDNNCYNNNYDSNDNNNINESSFIPSSELLLFLSDTKPIIFVGFGSMVIDNVETVLSLFLEAAALMGGPILLLLLLLLLHYLVVIAVVN